MDDIQEQEEEIVVEAFDDRKAEDILAGVIGEIMNDYKPGGRDFIREKHAGLSNKIDNIEDKLTVARLRADMKAFCEGIAEYTSLLLEGCRVHNQHLAELDKGLI